MPPKRTHLHTFAALDLPETIYFDSSFIAKTLIAGLSYHQECMDFVRRLEQKQPIVVISKFSIVELRCAAIKICIQNHYASKGHTGKIDLDNILYGYPELVSRFHTQAIQIEKDVYNLLQRFTYRILEDVNDEIIDRAQPLMSKYSLGSYDAVHIATMDYWKIKDIAVFDHIVEDISDFNVWTCGGSKRHKERWYKRAKLPRI